MQPPVPNYTPLPQILTGKNTPKPLTKKAKIILLTFLVVLVVGLGAGIVVLRSSLTLKTPAAGDCVNLPEYITSFVPPCPLDPACDSAGGTTGSDGQVGCTSPREGYCKVKTQGICFECYGYNSGIRMVCVGRPTDTPTSPPQKVCPPPNQCIKIPAIPPDQLGRCAATTADMGCPNPDELCCNLLPTREPTPPPPTDRPTPTIPSPTSTPSPTGCDTPQEVTNISIDCPLCE